MSACVPGSSRRRAGTRSRCSSSRASCRPQSWAAVSASRPSWRCRPASRRASGAASSSFPTPRSGCCCSPRPSRPARWRCCGAQRRSWGSASTRSVPRSTPGCSSSAVASRSGIRSCVRRSTRQRRPRTGAPRTGRSPTPLMPTRIRTVVPGTAPRPRSAPTTRWPTSWSARPAGRRRAAAWRPPPRSSSAPSRSRSIRARERGARSKPRQPSSWRGRPRRRCPCCRLRRTGRRSASSTRPWCSDSVGRSRWTSDARATRCRCCSMRLGGSKRSIPASRAETYLEAIRAASVAGRLGGGMRGRGEGRARRAAAPGRSERRRPAARRARDPLHRRLRRQRERAQAGVGRRARRGWPGRSGRPLAMDRPAGRSGPVRRRHVARARHCVSVQIGARYGRAGGAPARAQPALAGAVLRGRAGRRRRAARRG